MEILKDFGLFIYDIAKGFIELGVGLLTVYIIFYFLMKMIACGRSKSDYKKFRKSFNGACMNYVNAFYEISVASLDSAKLWAENKLLKNKETRRNRVYHQ